MGVSRQEHWSRLPSPSPGSLLVRPPQTLPLNFFFSTEFVLHCCLWAFYSFSVQKLLSSCTIKASHWGHSLIAEDGGAENCSLISMRTPKSQLAIEQPLAGWCWNLPEKDTPHSRTKEKGKRGAIRLNSNPIPIKWVTHKLENNNTKKILALLQRF